MPNNSKGMRFINHNEAITPPRSLKSEFEPVTNPRRWQRGACIDVQQAATVGSENAWLWMH
jgi:hypothetical protein